MARTTGVPDLETHRQTNGPIKTLDNPGETELVENQRDRHGKLTGVVFGVLVLVRFVAILQD